MQLARQPRRLCIQLWTPGVIWRTLVAIALMCPVVPPEEKEQPPRHPDAERPLQLREIFCLADSIQFILKLEASARERKRELRRSPNLSTENLRLVAIRQNEFLA